jgi:ArsR family transcriptional regulator, arsenate/arsenite/antimonite-responsive transcriptional repressor
VNALGLLKALAHEIRFEIVQMLHTRDLCVCELEVALGVSQSKVSYHLGVLREAGFVSLRQDGRWSVYSLEPKSLMRLGGMVQEALAEPCDLSHVPDCRALEIHQTGLLKETECVC